MKESIKRENRALIINGQDKRTHYEIIEICLNILYDGSRLCGMRTNDALFIFATSFAPEFCLKIRGMNLYLLGAPGCPP